MLKLLEKMLLTCGDTVSVAASWKKGSGSGGRAAQASKVSGGLSQFGGTHDFDLSHLVNFCKGKLHVRSITSAVI